MRRSVKLLLIVPVVAACMACAAAPASATDAVQIVNEKTGLECGSGCTAHAVGLATYRVDLGIFGEAHEATCNVEVIVPFLIGVVVGMAISQWINIAGDANCSTTIPPCNLPWAVSEEEDGPTGVVQATANVCFDPAEGPECSGALAFNINEVANEGLQIEFNNSSFGLCEMDLDLAFESSNSSNAALHINHP